MRGKRGDIEMQFNWMFVFIVGTLILALAAGFVIKQKKNSDTIVSGQIIRFTRSVIAISSATPGKAEPQPLQKEIGVSCDPESCTDYGCTSDFFVKPRTQNAVIDTKTGSIFAPSTIKGETLGTWSMDWNMPYHISNFLYVTSDQVRYVFVSNTDYEDMIDELYSEMPDIMGKKELVDNTAAIKNKNNYKVKLIFFNQNPTVPSALSSLKADGLSAINIIPGEGMEIGKIEFYKKSGNSFAKETPEGDPYYLGKPAIYGAIFSEGRDFYECNMNKALLRQKIVSELYAMKIETLMASDKITNPACKTAYGSAVEKINNMIPLLDLENAENIKTLSDEISAQNTALKLKSCPMIY